MTRRVSGGSRCDRGRHARGRRAIAPKPATRSVTTTSPAGTSTRALVRRRQATRRSARARASTPCLRHRRSICSPATCCCSTAWPSRPSRPYRAVDGKRYAFALRPAGMTQAKPLSSNTEDLKDGDFYTAIAMPGDGHGPSLRVVNDHLDSPASGKARLRVVHAGGDAGTIDVRAAGAAGALFDDVDYQTVTDYRDVAPMNGAAGDRRRGQVGAGRWRRSTAHLEAGRFYTLVIVGNCARRRQGGGLPDRRRAYRREQARPHHPRSSLIAVIVVAAIGIVISLQQPRTAPASTGSPSNLSRVARKRSRARRSAPQLDSAAPARQEPDRSASRPHRHSSAARRLVVHRRSAADRSLELDGRSRLGRRPGDQHPAEGSRHRQAAAARDRQATSERKDDDSSGLVIRHLIATNTRLAIVPRESRQERQGVGHLRARHEEPARAASRRHSPRR